MSDSDEDPFAGIDVEGMEDPTQEDIDDWATLDVDDEPTPPEKPASSEDAATKAHSKQKEDKAGVNIAVGAQPAAVARPAPSEPGTGAAAAQPGDTALLTSSINNSVPTQRETADLPAAAVAKAVAAGGGQDEAASSSAKAGPQQEPFPPGNPEAGDAAGSGALDAPSTSATAPPPDPTAAAAAAPAPPQAPASAPARPPAAASEIQPASPAPPHHPPAAGDDDEYFDEDALGEDDDKQQQQQPRQQQQRPGWGGWGAGWGLGSIGGKLREVAAGAVRDVKDLTETFQAALAIDVTGAEDEEEEAGRLAAMDRAEEEGGEDEEAEEQGGGSSAGQGAATAAPHQLDEPVREGGRAHHSAREGAAGVAPAAAAGGGQQPSGAAGSAGPGSEAGQGAAADPALEVGLQAIDAQVEQLASGAAKAFSSLWGGLSSVARVVAAEVAASVADVQSSSTVRGVAQIGSKLAHTAERGLETVGRTAMVLLEEVAGVQGGAGGAAGRRRIWGDEADARAADMGRDPTTFQDFFYIYGGEQLAEEVAGLANECAHLVNRSRSRLEADQQAALDAVVARLGPYFNDPWVLKATVAATAPAAASSTSEAAASAEAGDGAGPELPPLDDSSTAAQERLDQMYDPIGFLVQDSLGRAEAFVAQIREALEEQRRRRGKAAEDRAVRGEAAAEQRGGDEGTHMGQQDAAAGEDLGAAAEEGEAEEGEAEEGEAEEGEGAGLHAGRDPAVLLAAFRCHCAKRLAEVCTAQLQLLLNLGASLAAPARTGRPAVDGIPWPPSSEQQAGLLAREVQRAVADVGAVEAAYRGAVQALAAHLRDTARAGAGAGTAPGGGSTGADVGKQQGKEAEADEGEWEQVEVEAEVEAVLLEEVEELGAALPGFAQSAAGAVQGGYRGLLYAVLLRSLVTQIAQGEEGEEEDEPGKQGVEGEDSGEGDPAREEPAEEGDGESERLLGGL